jgi:hypothetical protein
VVGAVALGTAGTALTGKLAESGLPEQAIGVAGAVNAEGGALAVANADLGGLSRAVAPLARTALEEGLDLGMYVCAGAGLVAVVVALIGLRDTAATTAPEPVPAQGGTQGGTPADTSTTAPTLPRT